MPGFQASDADDVRLQTGEMQLQVVGTTNQDREDDTQPGTASFHDVSPSGLLLDG